MQQLESCNISDGFFGLIATATSHVLLSTGRDFLGAPMTAFVLPEGWATAECHFQRRRRCGCLHWCCGCLHWCPVLCCSHDLTAKFYFSPLLQTPTVLQSKEDRATVSSSKTDAVDASLRPPLCDVVKCCPPHHVSLASSKESRSLI